MCSIAASGEASLNQVSPAESPVSCETARARPARLPASSPARVTPSAIRSAKNSRSAVDRAGSTRVPQFVGRRVGCTGWVDLRERACACDKGVPMPCGVDGEGDCKAQSGVVEGEPDPVPWTR